MNVPSSAVDAVAAGVRRFLAAELIGHAGSSGLDGLAARPPVSEPGGRAVHVAAIGTTAARAVRGELLASAIAQRGFELATATAHPDPDALLADAQWGLAVVLSPWKQAIGAHCDVLARSATATGVVDTVVRTAGGLVGFNTNTWAAMSAMELVLGGAAPTSVVVLGSGASARSISIAVTRGWPSCELLISARSRPPAEALAADYGGRLLDDLDPALRPTSPLVVNTTTWGETEESEAEPFPIDLTGLFVPGARYFDLNNRIGTLAHRALAAGCAVVSGSMMQRVTNACRAALLHYSA